jgi:peptide/nickel transport system ATP-binding protein
VTGQPEHLLEVRDLDVDYPGRSRRAPRHRVLTGVNLDVRPGETMGLVGETGSGKSTLGRAVLGLVAPARGRILFRGEDVTHTDRARRRQLATSMQVVFQDPYTSLNPTKTIGSILAEPLRVGGVPAAEAGARIRSLLDRVDLPADAVDRHPHEFSGGQRQRVAIARALALEPELLICDEPVSALDLSTQARILDLLVEVQERTGVSYLFISHDLSVVRAISHRVAVMKRGEIVELGDAAAVTSTPQHPYTRELLLASPVPDPDRQARRRAERLAARA